MTRPILTAALGLGLFATPTLAQDLPIAVQMYTLRDFGTLEEQLAAVQAAGVKAVETVGTQKVSAEELNALLEKYDIEVISTHAQLADLRDDLAGVIAFNKAVGNDVITVPNLREEVRPTDAEGWKTLGEEFKAMSDTLKAEDMSLVYHNHDYEMQMFDGRTALEIMLEAAGPDVRSELDAAWVARTGIDPAEYIEKLDGRLFAIHAKDNAPEGTAVEQRGFAAVGEGVLNWDTLLPAATKAGAEWFIIEHDMPADAAAVITTGADYLRANLPAAK